VSAAGGHAGDESLDDGGLAHAGLSEDEDAGVGDESFAQPFQGIEADDLTPEQMTADRYTERGGA
jgi:hypothetical protein